MDGAIRRPDVPEHFMVLKPISRRIIVRSVTGTIIAESTRATRLIEAGRTIFDPVVYIPREDVVVSLNRTEKSTHCPLKGDASYFDVTDGSNTLDEVAWSYETPLEFSSAIKSLVAFYPDRVILEEHPG